MSKRRITKEIKQELHRLAAASRTGRLHWEDVVKAAKNKNSPLHSYFDFSQKAAMDAYLRQQAEGLIVSYYATIIHPTSGDKVRTRAFVSLTPDRKNGGGYRSIVSVLSDDDLKAQMLKDALSELASFKQRYKNLQELSYLFREIEELEERHAAKANGRGASRASREARAVGH